MKTKFYYYVIEQRGENIGQQGYYSTKEEAQKRADELQEMFDRSNFYVYANDSKREPVFLTV
jgi:hypothetical protein